MNLQPSIDRNNMPTLADLHVFVKLPEDNETHIRNLERAYTAALTEISELRSKLNLVLNMHSRNLETATNAFQKDLGHHCDSRKAVEAIMQRSFDAIRIKA